MLFLLTVPIPATAAPTCIDTSACAGETTQSPCSGPSPKQDPWDGFTGAWGNVSGVEWGAGGWSRCLDDEWAAGAFVNMDTFPLGSYQTVMVRFDLTQRNARDCYVGGGAYGFASRDYYYACPDWLRARDLPEEVQDPGWGHVLS